MKNETFKGDCLIESDKIESGSVDLILTDLPFGTMDTDGGRKMNINGWDKVIPIDKINAIANRILRKNGKMVLFAQEPFTTNLINSAIPNIPFSYRAIWEKDNFANALGTKRNMVSFYEDIVIFSKRYDFEGMHPLRPYFKKVMQHIDLNLKQINNKLGHRRAEHAFYIDSTQFELCTEQTYNELIEVFRIDKMDGFKNFNDLIKIDDEFKKQFASTFNLWEGKKYKSNILKYKKDYDGLHPTQKPVLLLEDLIKTFSNEGDTVVDLTAGSFSTAIACINTKRFYKCIEKDENYYNIGINRIEEYWAKELADIL